MPDIHLQYATVKTSQPTLHVVALYMHSLFSKEHPCPDNILQDD